MSTLMDREAVGESAPVVASQPGYGEDTSAIDFVEEVLGRALRWHASDVHVEPTPEGGRVRLRVDGVLREICSLPPELCARVILRLKVLGGMDIAERRLPQDGHFTHRRETTNIDIRLASLPTTLGERICARIVDEATVFSGIDTLGMPPALAHAFRAALASPCGCIVVCGPTGSGKTTTLYAALAERMTPSLHVCTVEDPVEARVRGATQVQVNAKTGLTFELAARALLRADPNVVMIGEVRDLESAHVATRAALSGHLVLTSLHASNACSAIDRLVELGIERAVLASTLTALIGQRLLRRPCDRCAGVPARTHVCEHCNASGYRGRIAVFEGLFVDDSVREAIGDGRSQRALTQLARAKGFPSVEAHAKELHGRGDTDLHELIRILGWNAVA